MNSSAKLLLKNSVLFSISPFLPKVVNILLMPIITRYLSDVDYGIAGTISAYSQAIGAFSTLGLTVVLMNSYYKESDDYKEIWRNIYGFLSIWMIFFAVLQAVLLYYCIPVEAEANKWWIIILTNFSTVFFGPTGTIGMSYFIYQKESWPVVWRSMVSSLLTIVANFVLIVFLHLGYMGWYVGSFIGTFFINLSYWHVVNKELGITPKRAFNRHLIKKSLAVSVPTIPHYYTSYLLEGSGRVVMDQCGVSRSEIGKIGIPIQFGDMFQSVIKGLNDTFQPVFMQSIKQNTEDKLKKIGLLFIGIVFSAAFLASVWSKEIFSILISNESLSSAYNYFIFYIMALCYRPLYCISSTYYFYYEKTKQLLLITFISGILAFVLYFLLTSKYGVWAFLIGHYVACLYFGYSGYFFKCYRKSSRIRMPVFLILIVQLLLTVSAYLLVEHLIIKIVVSVFSITFIAILLFWYKKRYVN